MIIKIKHFLGTNLQNSCVQCVVLKLETCITLCVFVQLAVVKIAYLWAIHVVAVVWFSGNTFGLDQRTYSFLNSGVSRARCQRRRVKCDVGREWCLLPTRSVGTGQGAVKNVEIFLLHFGAFSCSFEQNLIL